METEPFLKIFQLLKQKRFVGGLDDIFGLGAVKHQLL